MSDGLGLNKDELEQLNEMLGKDPARIDKFLAEYFPEQHQRQQAARGESGADLVEGVDYKILGEGAEWVEFESRGAKVRLEREPFKRTAGRPRENPWIDTRYVSRLGDPAVRAACYVVAGYKLRQEGQTLVTQLERTALAAARKRTFKGEEGQLAVLHLTGVARHILDDLRAQPKVRGANLEQLVTRAVAAVVAGVVSKDLEA